MPRISDRQKQLRTIKNNLNIAIALQSSSSDSDDERINVFDKMVPLKTTFEAGSFNSVDLTSDSSFDGDDSGSEDTASPSNLLELYFILYSKRYFVRRHVTLKSNEFATQFFHSLPDLLFKQLTRMNKNSFFHLVDLISPHPIFENSSAHEQASVVRQLAVCLDRLGHNGNGACINHLIPTWGVSTGSLCNFLTRCFTALESVLASQVKWPVGEERAEITAHFKNKGFSGCIGLIDGSLLPLAQRPARHGECYYDRKSRYSMNAQVVCDHRQKIICIYTGMPGSCSDLTCLRRSPLSEYCNEVGANTLFGENEYILGDSGYQALPHLVCAFKRSDTCVNKEDFNTCVAKARVTNEHCIGVLKSRWHSLKEIRVQLNSQKDSVWMVRWILLSCKLHNYVISQNDEWTEIDEELQGPVGIDTDATGDGQEPPRPSRRRVLLAGNSLLLRVMDEALQFHRASGQFLFQARE